MSRERRSDEAQDFFNGVYQAVQQIPYGKVTSYGHIAYLIGLPQRPRQVGVCLKHLPSPSPSSLTFNSSTVPWQRVISSKGTISPRSVPEGTQAQAAALEAEGVEVQRRAMGELYVDFEEFGWFPEVLPSLEEGAGGDVDGDPRESENGNGS